jgi:hypothetical protein
VLVNAKIGIPFLAPRDHGVEDDDELAHAGDERNLRLLPRGDQAPIECLEHGIVPRRGPETGHVEEIADLAASATVSSLRDLTLGDRFSQAWKPDRDTPIASHSHATGQMFRCFAMKTNFMSLPSRRRPRPFLGYPAQPSAC